MNDQAKRIDRPWGYFSVLSSATTGHQVKEIVVFPKQRLSLQSHRQRSEHWVVVSGPALITINENEQEYPTGAHVFVPLGSKHRLANPGSQNIKIVEVQIGDYLGEDDILRYLDDYQRV